MENYSKAHQIINNINTVIVGKEDIVKLVVVNLLAEGHLLLEDVPGIGKTTIANSLAKSIDCGFSRIQFTPDTLPSDVTGTSIYNVQKGEFEFVPGAVMSNIILADEINRTSPKTQASLLEAMEEKQVTADGKTYQLEAPFMVIATQNPIDFLGTYNLPEAQLDRFLMKLSIGYPSLKDEQVMAGKFIKGVSKETLNAVATKEDVVKMQNEVKNVKVDEDIVSYVVNIVDETRKSEQISLGASPRATLALIRAAQAYAYVEGREYVIPDDVKSIAYYVLGHRLVLSMEAKINKIDMKEIINKIVGKVKVPVYK
jgi:MoxR-like ATPase